MSELLVEVYRGDIVESRHRGSAVVVDTAGRTVWSVGDPDTCTFMRSSAKPVQALAVVESGAYDSFGIEPRELAVMCASHGAEPFHVEAVLGILHKLGLEEVRLQCGSHWPSHRPSAVRLAREGSEPSAVHCNCSGKHAGMLAVCLRMGWSIEDYWQEDHPLQRLCLENMASVSGWPAGRIGLAKDGCGVLVFALPLRNMALALARMANPDDPRAGFSPERARAASLITGAMRAHPEMVAGTDRLCTALMQNLSVVAKGGAEGVYCFGLPGRGLGGAVKIDDGASRAVGPVVIRLLDKLGLLDDLSRKALARWAEPAAKNHRGEVVGRVRAVFSLREEWIA